MRESGNRWHASLAKISFNAAWCVVSASWWLLGCVGGWVVMVVVVVEVGGERLVVVELVVLVGMLTVCVCAYVGGMVYDV